MKKITITFFSVLAIQFANAQAKITLIMNPRPIANINDWAGRRDMLSLTVSPGGPLGSPHNVKINTTIKTADGTIVAVTNMLKAPVKTLLQGKSTTFYAADVVNMKAMVFETNFQSKLSAGSYQIIVRVITGDVPNGEGRSEAKTFKVINDHEK